MDRFVSCPYNASHRVPQSRIQAHIIKCQTKRPELFICPYNATHRMQETDLKRHVMSCPSRKESFPEDKPEPFPPKVTADISVPKTRRQKDFLSDADPDYEMWDE